MHKDLKRKIFKERLLNDNIVKNGFSSWAISFLVVSFILCSWFIVKAFAAYFEYEVVTKISIEYSRNKMIWPVINICSINTFTNNISDLVMYCYFNYNYCDLHNDFEYFNDSTHGNCIRYNSGRSMNGTRVAFKYANQNGVIGALSLLMYIGSARENSDSKFIDQGLQIFVNNKSEDSMMGEGFMVKTGCATYAAISKYLIVKKPKPYSNCIDDLTSIDSYPSECFKKAFLANHREYYFSYCRFMCIQRLLGDNCHCQYPFYNNFYYYENMSQCHNTDNCMFQQLQSFVYNSTILEACDCPFECNESGYTVSTSYSDFPTKGSAKKLSKLDSIIKKFPNKSERNFENFKQSLTFVAIYYDQLKETITKQEEKITRVDLVSNIGGILGLFLGFSVLSVVKLFEVLFQIIFILCHRKSHAQKVEITDFVKKLFFN